VLRPVIKARLKSARELAAAWHQSAGAAPLGRADG